MKEQLRNCGIVLVPYWLVDAIRANNEKLSILAKYDDLRRILTKGDLDFYAKSYQTVHGFVEGQPIIQALADTCVSTWSMDVFGDSKVGNYTKDRSQFHDRNSHYMSNAAAQFIRPTSDGVVNLDAPLLFDLFVIDDRDATDKLGGTLTLGLTLSTNASSDPDDAALIAMSNSIELLSKYYGVDQVVQTTLVNKYMQLKKRELLNPNIMSNNVAVES